jgi:SagB-type dehydrogenase family enzyme
MPEAVFDLCAQHLATLDGGMDVTDVDRSYILRANACSSEGVDLPESLESQASLSSVLRNRRSATAFSAKAISLSTLGTIVAESAGVAPAADHYSAFTPTGPRPYPSGGALYPVELLVYPIRVDGLANRFWYYQALANRFVPISNQQSPREVADCYSNECIRDSAALILLFVDFTRPSLGRYGGKAYRLLLLEGGHVAQVILLTATAVGLASLPLCGFQDERLAVLSGLSFPAQSVIYSIAVGVGT